MSETDDDTAPSRPRRKRKNYSLLILVAGILAFGAAAGAMVYVLRPTTLKVAVGPAGSDDVKLIQAFAQTFARENSSIRLTPVVTAGATESIAELVAHKVDLAVARGDLNLPANAELVAILRKNVVVLWSPSGLPPKGSKKQPAAKIKSIDDLTGHKVGVIGRTQANVALLKVILTESGVNADKVTIVQYGTNQIADMARDATLDAYMTVGPLESKITADAIAATATARGEPKFLPIEVSEAIAQRHPIYESEEIAGSIFSSSPARPEDKVETVSVNHVIIVPHTMAETTAAALTRQLFTLRHQVARDVPSAAKIEKPDTDKDASLPAHQGAAAYIDGNERTFLEKYTDYIWGVILVLSGLGSAGAWLRHYWRRDEREQFLAHRDNLLELISKARQAETPDELSTMQRQADDLLREALDCYDAGAIEEDDLSVIGLTLEQFHHAIADRRAALGGEALEMQRMRVG